MTIETAQYLHQLNPAYPEGGSFAAQLDDSVRLVKTVLKNTFPNFTGPMTSTQAQLDNPIPSGLIVMWSGTPAAVPSGWRVCDGTLSTPDLRDKFVVGAGTTYATGTSGGSLTVVAGGTHTPVLATAGAHDHSAVTGATMLTIAQIPAHAHTLTVDTYTETGVGKLASGGATVNDGPVSGLTTDSVGSGAGHSHAIAAELAHTHVATVVPNHTHTYLPPYYALMFIMKT